MKRAHYEYVIIYKICGVPRHVHNRNVHYPYGESYKTLLIDIKEGLKIDNYALFGGKKYSFKKMPVLPILIYYNSSKTFTKDITELDKVILKLIWKSKTKNFME